MLKYLSVYNNWNKLVYSSFPKGLINLIIVGVTIKSVIVALRIAITVKDPIFTILFISENVNAKRVKQSIKDDLSMACPTVR